MSGKKRQNTGKATMISDGQGRELWLGAIRPGRMHDVTQIRTEGIEEQLRLHQTVKVEVDSGYLGLVRDFPGQVSGPPKKPSQDAGPSQRNAYDHARRRQSSDRISAARPGRTSEITACRHDKLTGKLREAGLGAIADLGFVGLDDGGPDADPAVITGYKTARNRPLTRGQKLSNTALAAVRAPVEHGFAHLKNWRVLGKVCTDSSWTTALVRALRSSRTAKSPDDRRSSPKSPASDQHEHPDAHAHQTRDQKLQLAHRSVGPVEAKAASINRTCSAWRERR